MSEFDDLGSQENGELLRDLESLTTQTQLTVLRDAVADLFDGKMPVPKGQTPKEYLNAQAEHKIDEILQNGPAHGYTSFHASKLVRLRKYLRDMPKALVARNELLHLLAASSRTVPTSKRKKDFSN